VSSTTFCRGIQGVGLSRPYRREAGIGKTRLVQAVVDSGHERRVHGMVGAARPFETTRTEMERTDILQRVDGEIDTLEASKQLGVTRARVNQLLRRRRAGDPRPADHHHDRQARHPTRPQNPQEESREHRARLRPDQAQPQESAIYHAAA
jgi:hypothetical protein